MTAMNAIDVLFEAPHRALPEFENQPPDLALLGLIQQALREGRCEAAVIEQAFAASTLPQRFVRIIFILYAPGHRRILVTRARPGGPAG